MIFADTGTLSVRPKSEKQKKNPKSKIFEFITFIKAIKISIFFF